MHPHRVTTTASFTLPISTLLNTPRLDLLLLITLPNEKRNDDKHDDDNNDGNGDTGPGAALELLALLLLAAAALLARNELHELLSSADSQTSGRVSAV